MASQTLYFVKLAADMKKAAKRKADESDSEDSIEQNTNRGNKLRKKARFVREGQLADPSGPQVYKKTITYNDLYQRDIISERPLLYDEDGYEIDSEDDEDGTALAEASEFYPYSDVRIEELLAPLMAAADLPNHPTLSQPFTSKTLTELTNHAREMLQKEQSSLWRMKRMLISLSGDTTWAPCENFETPDDINLFSDGRYEYREHLLAKNRSNHTEEALNDTQLPDERLNNGLTINGSLTNASVEIDGIAEDTQEVPPAEDDVVMVEASTEAAGITETNAITKVAETDAGVKIVVAEVKTTVDGEAEGEPAPDDRENGDQNKAPSLVHQDAIVDSGSKPEESVELVTVDGEQEDEDDQPAPHRMRTRAQAQAASDNTGNGTRSMTPESNESYIHPFFLVPPSAIPDPNIGLPEQEAEETRRLLQLYVQKQEEVCRGIQKLYEGLLKADRLRKTVMKWAKADGHVGEMSDGEDWYDKEEWGLTEDLKKGQDEEEEDAATTAKKTRTRRQ